MDKSLDVCKDGGCRVLHYNTNLDIIAVSMKTPNVNFFGDFGVRQINMSTYKPLSFLPLHKGAIRDIRYHTTNDLLLSASLDKTVKVSSCQSNTNSIVCSYTTDSQLWCCCWDALNSNIFYVGNNLGSVTSFDMRQTNESLSTINAPDGNSPIMSIVSVPSSPGQAMPHGGIVFCKLNSVWAVPEGDSVPKQLPFEGPFNSMTYKLETKLLLISARPNARLTKHRHILCDVGQKTEITAASNVLWSFEGGSVHKQINRSCFISHKSDYVAAYEEANKKVFLWSITTGKKVAALPAYHSVLDLCPIQKQDYSALLSLSDKKLEIFKFSENS